MKQTTFASLTYVSKKRRTKRELFLDEMDTVVPRSTLETVIKPYCPKAGKLGGQPKTLRAMLRIYFMQNSFGLSNHGMEDALYEIESMCRFVGLELNEIALPDEMTILNFRHLLEVHQLTTQLMNTIVLTERNILLKGCAMVDATLTHAPSSTKNADKVRDPEMHQTKKCKQLYFGIKVHVSTDVNRGMVHTVSVTSANAPDKSQLPGLSRDDDRALFCDKGDVDNRLKRVATNKRASREHSSIRSRVEHIFRVMKWQFGYAKARYCGLAKNTAQVITLIGLTNLYLVRRRMAA